MNLMSNRKSLWIALPAALLAAGFAFAPEKKVTKATAVVHPTKGQTVTGTVKFEAAADGVKISWELTGLTPGKHGFHIHELGDCNCDDGKCAGGHFNPEGKKHGGPAAADRHVGDLGNIEADAKGVAKGESTDKLIALGGAHSIIGRSVMIHEKEDDLATDPTGNAGGRIGLGAIGIAKEE
jgi:Cu-Zn family superoxide dismutase